MKLNKKQAIILLIISILANISIRIYMNDWSLLGNSFFIGFTYGWIGVLLIANFRKLFMKEKTDISQF